MIRIGFQVWGQNVDWQDLAGAASTIEARGFDSVWANDHLYPIAGDGSGSIIGHDGPVFEASIILAAWAAATDRVRLGWLVAGAAYRNPGFLVKVATTLDHMAGGRTTLGIGAGWHEREHAAFGFAYPAIGERLDRLEEQAAVVRGLLDGEAVTYHGRWVSADGARNLPAPAQTRLRLLIGGSGERRTLGIVARYADIWNGEGDSDTFARKNAVLDARCAEIGRDPASIERTVGLAPVCIRDSRPAAIDALAAILARHSPDRSLAGAWAASSPFADSEDGIASSLRAYASAGAAEVMFDWPPPFDTETLERLAGPVRERLQ